MSFVGNYVKIVMYIGCQASLPKSGVSESLSLLLGTPFQLPSLLLTRPASPSLLLGVSPVSSSHDLRLRVSESLCVSESPPRTTCVSESPSRSLCASPSLLLAQPLPRNDQSTTTPSCQHCLYVRLGLGVPILEVLKVLIILRIFASIVD